MGLIDFDSINWKELKQQKLTLINISWLLSQDQIKDIDGLLNLIDFIQDAASETGMYQEDDIFLSERELDENDAGKRIV